MHRGVGSSARTVGSDKRLVQFFTQAELILDSEGGRAFQVAAAG